MLGLSPPTPTLRCWGGREGHDKSKNIAFNKNKLIKKYKIKNKTITIIFWNALSADVLPMLLISVYSFE